MHSERERCGAKDWDGLSKIIMPGVHAIEQRYGRKICPEEIQRGKCGFPIVKRVNNKQKGKGKCSVERCMSSIIEYLVSPKI